MKVSNIVISTVSAISMAGALGIAYAQSTYTEPQPGTGATTSQEPGTMNQDPSTMNQDPSGTAGQGSPSTMSQDSTGAPTQDSTAASQDSGSTMSQDSTAATPDDATDPAATPRSRTYNERVARADRN